jgi:hypothetical protein
MGMSYGYGPAQDKQEMISLIPDATKPHRLEESTGPADVELLSTITVKLITPPQKSYCCSHQATEYSVYGLICGV